MRKKFSFIFLMAILIISSCSTSLMAIPIQDSKPQTESSKETVPRSSKRFRRPDKHGKGRYHNYRPFRRFTDAIENLKANNKLSAEDVKKIYDVLIKMMPENMEKVADQDQGIAEMLYKDKVITEDQYKMICDYLRNNPMPR